MSSRNKYLEGDLRVQARVLSRALGKARSLVRESGSPLKADALKNELKRFIQQEPSARVDYIEFFEPQNLVPVSKVTRGVQMALAVFIGKTRLIDNGTL